MHNTSYVTYKDDMDEVDTWTQTKVYLLQYNTIVTK